MTDTMTIEELHAFQETGVMPKRLRKKTRLEVIESVAEKAPDLVSAALEPKRNKYGAIKTEVDGIVFASKKEARRYTELKAMELAGAITDLSLHPAWKLEHNGVHIGRYTADFMYTDTQTGEQVVEDTKSPATKKARDYGLRKKMMLAFHGIKIKET